MVLKSLILVLAVAAVGNNTGAVHFLLRDGAPILLEVNPIWGAGPRRYSFGNAGFERLVEQTENFWSKELPNIAYNLDVVRFYREMLRLYRRVPRPRIPPIRSTGCLAHVPAISEARDAAPLRRSFVRQTIVGLDIVEYNRSR